MIITKQKPLEEILESLKDEKNIFIVGCGECATTCKTGGEEEVAKIKDALAREGKVVTGWVIPEAPCIEAQVKKDLAKKRKELKAADAILVLACGLGVQSVMEHGRFGKAIHPGCDTLFAGTVSGVGDFNEYCSACGECILDQTGGICPVTRCPKGLLNGPCGGAKEGKCEVEPEKDCVWELIYKRLQELGKLDKMKEYRPPKDYSKASKPRSLSLELPAGGKEQVEKV